MSLRLRLTFWYGLIVAVVLGGFSVMLYLAFERNAVAEVDRLLAAGVADAQAAMPLGRGPRILPGRILVVPNPPRVVPFGSPSTFFQTLDVEGNIVTQSANLEGAEIPLTEATFAALEQGRAVYETVALRDLALRTYAAPLSIPGTPIAYVQVARSLDSVESALANLRALLITGSVLAVVVSGVVGWALAGSALRPVKDITTIAERIRDSEDLAQRIDYRGPRDEIGRLAATFNRMMERLQGTYARVESALESQRRFTADASHELRTPVTSIRVNADTLLRNPDLPVAERRAALTDIAAEAQRMSRLIAQLLTLARADAGLHPALRPVAPDVVVEAAVARLAPIVNNTPVRTRFEPEARGGLIHGDPELLGQVIAILADNAVRYGGAGKPIDVSLRRDNGDYVIAVADRGPGIPSDELPHVFERFYRGKAAAGEGSGLGLAIARWIIDEHGGAIDVVSEPHQGSVFSVRLPAVQ